MKRKRQKSTAKTRVLCRELCRLLLRLRLLPADRQLLYQLLTKKAAKDASRSGLCARVAEASE
jgi:hypothetical protein